MRNRPSFEVALVPEFLPQDDTDTETVDEEAQEIEKVLRILRADSNDGVMPRALRVAELMFKKLGYEDYTRTLQKAGIEVTFLDTPAFVAPAVEGDRLVKTAPLQYTSLTLSSPCPWPALSRSYSVPWPSNARAARPTQCRSWTV